MQKRLGTGRISLLLLILLAGGHASASDLKMTLVIYNHAQISQKTLARAENLVAGLFKSAGVSLDLRDGFEYVAERQAQIPEPEDDPATLVVNLLPESAAAQYGVRSVCGGVALGSDAIVFVRNFDPRTGITEETRLGYLIGHELGHLLLGPDAHSAAGIMQATFLSRDWTKAAQGTLGFTRSQSRQVHMWVAERSPGNTQHAKSASPNGSSLEVLTLLFYDYARLPQRVTRQMEKRTGQIMSQAGIRLEWFQCAVSRAALPKNPCSGELESGNVVFQIFSACPEGRSNGGDVLGFALTLGNHIFLCADHIVKIERDNLLNRGSVMPYAVAHELGHLLLGPGHSAEGIMHSSWGKADFFAMERRRLRFSDDEAESIRRTVLAASESQIGKSQTSKE